MPQPHHQHHLPPSLVCCLHLLYTQFSHTTSLIELTLFSGIFPTLFFSKLIRACPFKIKLSEDLEAKPLIFYIPQTEAELQAIVKEFPK